MAGQRPSETRFMFEPVKALEVQRWPVNRTGIVLAVGGMVADHSVG